MFIYRLIPKPVREIYRYRNLLYQLVRRDISSRYQGSFLGVAWSFFFPLLTLGVYAVVFGMILSPRWPNVKDPAQFTLILFSGLLPFNFFSECVSRAPSLITANASYVKKVIFPVDLLIWIPIGTALFHLLLGVLAWSMLVLILGKPLTLTALALPVAILPLIFLIAGISWLLSAIGVYIRDVGQIIGVFIQTLLYLGPIIYPRQVLPKQFQGFMALNPVTVPVEQFRNVLNFGVAPNLKALMIYTLVALIIAYLGKVFFEKTRRGFANVV